MTEKEKEAVEQVMEGYRVGYAYLSPMEGIDRQEYVFDMTAENIANFIPAKQRAKRTCLHVHLATAARVKYPAPLGRTN